MNQIDIFIILIFIHIVISVESENYLVMILSLLVVIVQNFIVVALENEFAFFVLGVTLIISILTLESVIAEKKGGKK